MGRTNQSLTRVAPCTVGTEEQPDLPDETLVLVYPFPPSPLLSLFLFVFRFSFLIFLLFPIFPSHPAVPSRYNQKSRHRIAIGH